MTRCSKRVMGIILRNFFFRAFPSLYVAGPVLVVLVDIASAPAAGFRGEMEREIARTHDATTTTTVRSEGQRNARSRRCTSPAPVLLNISSDRRRPHCCVVVCC